MKKNKVKIDANTVSSTTKTYMSQDQILRKTQMLNAFSLSINFIFELFKA